MNEGTWPETKKDYILFLTGLISFIALLVGQFFEIYLLKLIGGIILGGLISVFIVWLIIFILVTIFTW